MRPDERERRRGIKAAYRAEHGGAMSPLNRMLEDQARRARLRGPIPALGFAVAIAGALEACRVRGLAPEVLLEPLAVGEAVSPAVYRHVERMRLLVEPAWPAPIPLPRPYQPPA